MKRKFQSSGRTPIASFFSTLVCVSLLCALSLGLFVSSTRAADRQALRYNAPAAVTNSEPLREMSRWKRLNLSIGLPLRDREGLTNLLAQIYDRNNPNFRHYLTTEEFTDRFGPTKEDYEAVVKFARTHGLKITARHANRMLVSVNGTVVDIERAFHVRMNEFQHPTEDRTFFAPSGVPTMDLKTPVLSVGGLDNFVVARKCLHPAAATQAKPNATGSGPQGTYLGYDFRAAYVPGVPLLGTGQTVGLLEFDSGFYQSDITAYETLAGLPTNVPVTAVLLDGYDGGPGFGNDEVSLDIEMAISMAPGLAGVLVYEGSTTDDILNRMATDNTAKQIGASWTYGIDATSEQIFLQFAAQGQAFFNASGDSDAYTGAVSTPSDDPNVIVVGGTTLTTTGPGGAWVSETVWNWGGGTGSSGGVSTVYPIPPWQQGLSMAANGGSTSMRNLPDVAMTADNVYVAFNHGQSGGFGGTSCATPLWAAFTALMNQLAVTNKEPLVGFLNPVVYAIGKGSNALPYTTLFHDTTTGNNESPSSPNKFVAVAGYDLCTGWGTPTGSNLITAIAFPEPLRITPFGGMLFSGPVGGPFGLAQNFSLTNSGANSLNWSLTNASLLFSLSPTSGGLTNGGGAQTVAVSVTAAATNLTPGTYSVTVLFTNLTDNFGQTRQLTLAVVTPPVITAQPTNLALLDGMTATFNVTTGSNALMYYQWQKNGVNLQDGGSISGAATSTLTITNVSTNNAGSYSVVLSNAAGTVASSNAALTIVPSPPVIVQQPASQNVVPGAPASFSVAAVGNTPYSYHWMFNGQALANGTAISGVTSNVLTLNNVLQGNAGTYTVVVSNSLGTTTSIGATLSLTPLTVPGLAMNLMAAFNYTNGANPYSPIIQATDGNFYGTAYDGGTTYGEGIIYEMTPNGTLSVRASFNDTDGGFPYGGLVQGKDGNLYGSASSGGTYEDGVVFRATTSGAISVLASFDADNGEFPVAGLVQASDGNFYGTTLEGGDFGYGTIFRITTAGTLTTLVSLDYYDGDGPSPVLIQGADGNLYGTCEGGGTYGWGTVFKMSLSGLITNLYSFTGGSDGGSPIPGLAQATDGNFYGTTYQAGSNGFGTVFEITPSGGFTPRYAFSGGNDGGNPWGGLMQASDGNLYGTTQGDGVYSFGTIFRLAPTGGFATVGQFDGYIGGNPVAALTQGKDGNLYGTAATGGLYDDGVVYQLAFSGPLQITGQPADQSVYNGGTALFTVATFGGGPVSYQWQQNGINLTNGSGISGVTTSTLVISNASVSDAAYYSVIVSNPSNSLTSDDALLEVLYSPPHITQQPASMTALSGTAAMFTVVATGDQPLTYQWRMNGINLTNGGATSGATTSTLTISNLALSSAGNYSVVVSNAIFAVTSSNAMLAVLPASMPGTAEAVLHQFADSTADGGFPYASLVEGSDLNLYGTTGSGGSHFGGTIFRSTLGGQVATLYNFPAGSYPQAPLMQYSNGIFYGTTEAGGTNAVGDVFRLTASGPSVAVEYSFTGSTDGAEPVAGLVKGVDTNLYGTALYGGTNDFGSVFKVTSAGKFTGLYSFTGGDDGAYPLAGVIQGSDGNFYGATVEAGAYGFGTVYKLSSSGTFTTLYAFDYTNGANPEASLVQGADGALYGTATSGGPGGYGTVFRVTTNGQLTTLAAFNSTNGGFPTAELAQGTDGNLYGTTSANGMGGWGTAFKVTTNGSLQTLLWFDGLNGATPYSGLVQASDGRFYGATAQGGAGFNPSAGGGGGTIFQITVPIFNTNLIVKSSAIACLPYLNSGLANFAVAPAGDVLTFGKVSGPAWLSVAANGVISGTPTNSDIGTNVFVVSLTDTNGFTATTKLQLTVLPDPPPSFVATPFSLPWANLDQAYLGTIATNVTDSETNSGDVLTFGKVSGPTWLAVGSDGTVTGTPLDVNAGSNTFVIGVTNLGGAFVTATLSIYVDSPPSFAPVSFSKPQAIVGIPYSGSIATNATDPDLIAGDHLNFYLVTGPSWLSVTTNGVLSGTPSSTNLGANTFLALVTDADQLSAVGTMGITVVAGNPPAWMANPFAGPVVVAGTAYSASVATNALDPNLGGIPTFVKMSGPAWLNVAANGVLSGTPLSANVGTNVFVIKVTDGTGLFSNANMSVNVTAAPPIVLSIAPQGSNVLLNWSGGIAPFQVKMATGLNSAAWTNVGTATSTTNMTITPSNSSTFYRVQGQ